MASSMKLPSQERYVRFQKNLHQNWAERTAIHDIAKSQVLIFWDNWSLSMCWVTYSTRPYHTSIYSCWLTIFSSVLTMQIKHHYGQMIRPWSDETNDWSHTGVAWSDHVPIIFTWGRRSKKKVCVNRVLNV